MKEIFIDKTVRGLIKEKYINLDGFKERCGLVLGELTKNRIFVENLVEAQNSRIFYGFGITLKEYERLMKISNKTFLGVFHTHPGDSTPSYSDINQMIGAPYPISMIISDYLPAPYFEIYYHLNKSIHNLTKEVLWNSS